MKNSRSSEGPKDYIYLCRFLYTKGYIYFSIKKTAGLIIMQYCIFHPFILSNCKLLISVSKKDILHNY